MQAYSTISQGYRSKPVQTLDHAFINVHKTKMKYRNAILLATFTAITLLTSCAPKIVLIGQLVEANPERIPQVLKYSKPDRAFQVIQTDDKTYLWLAGNGTVFPEGQTFHKDKITELAKTTAKKDKPPVKYFENGKFRVVHMPSAGNIFWDAFYLFEEFDKVPNANTLKFSSCNDANGLVYLFSYKK
jgi:hypothetical protein